MTLEQCWHRVPGGTALAAVDLRASCGAILPSTWSGCGVAPEAARAAVSAAGPRAEAAAASARALRVVASTATAGGRARDRSGRRDPRDRAGDAAAFGSDRAHRARPRVRRPSRALLRARPALLPAEPRPRASRGGHRALLVPRHARATASRPGSRRAAFATFLSASIRRRPTQTQSLASGRLTRSRARTSSGSGRSSRARISPDCWRRSRTWKRT